MQTLPEKIAHDTYQRIVEIATILMTKFSAKYHPTYTRLFNDTVTPQFHVETTIVNPFLNGLDYRLTFTISCTADPHKDGYYVAFDLINRTGDVIFVESIRLNPVYQPMGGSALNIQNRSLSASIGQCVEYMEALDEIKQFVTTHTLGTSIF